MWLQQDWGVFEMKRIFDLLASCAALILLSPVILCVAAMVRIRLGGPVLFKQVRPGLNGVPFEMYKFRTMTDQHDKGGHLLPDDQRLTQFERRLRPSSLDELPELLNVIKDDMSLVGPRPLLMFYLKLYSPEQMRRHDVRPGITGWAQVNGGNALTWTEKFALDIWNVANHLFIQDIRTLFATVSAVLTHRGITSDAHATMPPFTGGVE